MPEYTPPTMDEIRRVAAWDDADSPAGNHAVNCLEELLARYDEHAQRAPLRGRMTVDELHERLDAIDGDHVTFTLDYPLGRIEFRSTKADFLARYAPQLEAEDA